MKKMIAVGITNATNTGAVLVQMLFEDEKGNRTRLTVPALVTIDRFTCEEIYHADTVEHDEEMQYIIENATTKKEKVEGGKFTRIYKII